MTIPDISILIPSIRPSLLQGVYDSIGQSFHGPWELIIASPYPLPESLKDKPNIIYIFDNGTPIRGRQRTLLAANGKYICYAADDVIFYPNSLDTAFSTLKDKDYKTLVVGKYLEGSEDNPFMASNEYYYLKTHDFLKPIIMDNMQQYLLINTGLISTALMKEIGGFDCKFEACAMSCVDLSIRLQHYGAKCLIQNAPIFHSTHLQATLGDHAPIHNAQTCHDQPIFKIMYTKKESQNRTIIDIENWQNSADWWTRRFGKKDK